MLSHLKSSTNILDPLNFITISYLTDSHTFPGRRRSKGDISLWSVSDIARWCYLTAWRNMLTGASSMLILQIMCKRNIKKIHLEIFLNNLYFWKSLVSLFMLFVIPCMAPIFYLELIAREKNFLSHKIILNIFQHISFFALAVRSLK